MENPDQLRGKKKVGISTIDKADIWLLLAGTNGCLAAWAMVGVDLLETAASHMKDQSAAVKADGSTLYY